MNHLRTILAALLLAAAPAAAQTIKTLGYNTTNGNVVAARTNLTFTNSLVDFQNIRIQDFEIDATTIKWGEVERIDGEQLLLLGSWTMHGALGFNNTTNAATTRTNLGGTTVGNAVFTAVNPAVAAAAIGLGSISNVMFNTVTLYGNGDEVQLTGAGINAIGFGGELNFEERKLAQGGTNIFDWGSAPGFVVTPSTSFLTNVTVNGNVTTSGTLTATGNVTMAGTGNTAPNQTASSGASLMTRDLLYSAQTDDNSGDLFAGFTATSTAGAGTFAGASLVTGNVAQISTNTNSSAGVYFGDSIWTHAAFSGATMPSDKVIDLALKGVVLRVHTNTSFVMRVVFGVGTASRVPPPAGSDALSARGWGVNFFYNGTNYVYQPFWYTTNYNTGPAVALSNMSTAFSQWTGSVFTMRLRQETNGDIKFWINDGQGSRLAATPSFQTNVVWGTNAYGGRHFAIEAASATNAAAADLVRIGYRAAYIKYEP